MKWILTAAVLLAAGMIAAGISGGRTLRERDAAVREGVLVRVAHEIERELRESGPEGAGERMPELLAWHPDASRIELSVDGRAFAAAGQPFGDPVQTSVALGPAWRGLAGGGIGLGMGRNRTPFVLRLWPSPRLGDASKIALVTTWGSLFASLALLGFAIAAARGLEARQRSAALDAERRRLQTTADAGAGLAHRIRNPLATIKGTAQVLAAQIEPGQREKTSRIVEASIRIESLVDELLCFARPVEPRPVAFDLADLARDVAGGISVDAAEPVLVWADVEHATATIEELISNAKAFDSAAPLIAVARRGRMGSLEVRDRGPGLQIDASRAFDPYVTTRADGTGLGLPTIQSLVHANGGEVTLANREGGGCVASLLLPLGDGR